MHSLYNKELLYRSLTEGMDSREQAILDHYIKHKIDEAVEGERTRLAINIDSARDAINVHKQIAESEKNVRTWALLLLIPVYAVIIYVIIKFYS